MIESGSGVEQRGERGNHGQHAPLAVQSAYLQRVEGRHDDRRDDLGARKPHGIGALASLVRETVYTTFDALRGRYDR
jgi:hypothetical protein